MACNAKLLLLWLGMAGLAAAAGTAQPQPKLDEAALAGSAHTLDTADAKVFDDAIELIKQGNHALALLSLTRLTGSNPRNVAVRATRAYVLLQVGNLLGALDDARIAEKTGPHTAYRCWLLAQISYLAGNQHLCKREIKHLEGNAEYGAEAAKLGESLSAGKK
jgi:predicted Zn-dependent protease